MAEQSRESTTPKTEAEAKPPETVLLTVEELRAIAGGTNPPTPPKPVPKKTGITATG